MPRLLSGKIALLVFLALFSSANAQNLPPVHPGGPDFALSVTKEQLPPALEYPGEFRWARQWKEGGKRQVLIASEVWHATELRNELHLRQYGFGNGRYGVVWALKEFAPRLCKVEFSDYSLQIIDLDGDGRYETSFSYRVQHPEPEPAVLKLLMYRNGQKLAIRGKFPSGSEAKPEVEADPGLDSVPPVYRWYLDREWDRLVEKGEPWVHLVPWRGRGWFLLENRSQHGLKRIYYELMDSTGARLPIDEESWHRLQYARALYPMSGGGLMYVSDGGIGMVQAAETRAEVLLDLPEDTEGISAAAWSSDSSKVALVVLNVNQYPQSTRLYVLKMQNGALAGKEEMDVLVSHYGFDEWVITPPEFVNDSTLKVLEVPDVGLAEGAWREIRLR